MRKVEKIENEKFYTETLEQWLLNRGYYHHRIDYIFAYEFMYNTFGLSWHKTQKILFKKIPKEILDILNY